MKLFLILYFGGNMHIGGVAGPLNDPGDCARREYMLNELIAKSPSKPGIAPEKRAEIAKMRFSCEWRVTRPHLGDQK